MSLIAGFERQYKENYRTRGRYSPIGLDFGSGRIKILQLKQRSGQISPHQLAHFPSIPGAMTDLDNHREKMMVNNLKKVLNSNNWQGKGACLTLDSKACYLRLIKLPVMNNRELKQAVHWEAGNCFPFGPGEAIISYMNLDHKVAGRPGDFNRYLVAAVLKETANRYTDLTLKAGLNSLSLETPSTALLRSLAGRYDSENDHPKNYHLYIDLGYSSTLLLLCKNGGYCFHRSLPQGIKSIYKSIAVKTGSDHKTALQIVFNKNLDYGKSIATEIEYLIRGINESLAYWSDINQTAPITPSTLTVGGGGSFIAGLALFLQKSFTIKPVLDSPFQGLSNGSSKKELMAREQAALFSVAHGLALRGWLK